MSDGESISGESASGEVVGTEFVVTDEPDQGRFVMHRDGNLVGFADYRQNDGAVIVPHVETLIAYRGQGYGARLMDGLLDILRADGRRIVPLCPFAADHIRQNEQFHDLLN
ncbi:MAG: GNAT family N-acetyltransferase [Acidimicrobiales bacterium]